MSSVFTLIKAHKAFFQGICISEGSRLKRDATHQKATLLSKLRASEELLLHSPMVTRLRIVTSLRNQLKSLEMNKIVKYLMWAKQKKLQIF